MTARTPGTARRTSGRACDEGLEALLVLHPSPGDDERLVAARGGRRTVPGPQSSGSTPFGTTWTLSAGSSNAPTTSSRMNAEQQITCAGLVGEPPLDAVDRRRLARAAGGRRRGRARWRGWWRRGARPTATCSVSPAQATSQSWAWTTSGRQSSRRGGERHEVVVGAGHAGDEVVVGEPGQVGAGPEHPHAVDDRVVGGVGVVQREDDDLVPGPGQGSGQAVGVGRRCRRRRAVGTPTTAWRCARRANVAAACGAGGRDGRARARLAPNADPTAGWSRVSVASPPCRPPPSDRCSATSIST